MEKKVQAGKTRILLIYRRMIPSIRLCGHVQMEQLAAEGKIEYRAVKGMRLKAADLAWADVALLGRLDSWYELQIVKKLHAAGKTLIYIMDDDLLNIPDEVTSASYYHQECIRQSIREIIGLSGAILSPNPLLLERYAGGKTAIRTEEPALRPAPFTPHPAGRPVKIGFMGSPDRTGDLERILREALAAIRKEYGEGVRFEFFGARPSFADEIGANCIPYTESYDACRETLNRLEWDIGLAPMPESDFHACKHYIKFIEYSASGIAGIYSDVPPYDRLAAFPGCAALCGNRTEEWTAAIRSLLEDRKGREDMRRMASECACGALDLRKVSEDLFRQLPEARPGNGACRFGPLLPLKAVNVLKRFRTSVKGHGIGGFLRMIGGRAAARVSRGAGSR